VTSASLAPIGLDQAETSAIAALATGLELPDVSDYGDTLVRDPAPV
jgi:hypothetical protein